MDTDRSPRLLLASGSPRRRELIALLGLPFDVTTSDADEKLLPDESAASMVVRLSQVKANATRWPDASTADATILIAADTTVSLDDEVLGKPRDATHARQMLKGLRGRAHKVYSAITLIDAESQRQITDLAGSDVPMRNYSDDEIEAYIASGDPFDKAGAYAIQNRDFDPVEDMQDCFANVMGLPLCHLTRSLRALGVDVPVDVPSACQAHLDYDCPVFESILAETPSRE